MTVAVFAGVNTTRIAEATEGFPILVSFASWIDGHRGVVERDVLPRLRAGLHPHSILDSGAFSELTERGRSARKLADALGVEPHELTADQFEIVKADAAKKFNVSIDDYIEFCLEHGHLFSQVVTLDDIAGDLAVTWSNTAKMLEAGLDPVPVFHGREPFDVLRHYCEKFAHVGLGFFREPSGKKVVIAKDQGDGLTPDEWLTKALDICEAAGVEVHGFGMTRWALKLGHERLTTSDSTTWLAEYLAMRRRSSTGGDRLGDGAAAELLANLGDSELMKLALASYDGTGPDPEMETLLAEARGQAKTALARFTSGELGRLLAGFEADAKVDEQLAA